VNQHIKNRKFNQFVTHNRPHLDEICGRWQIRRFGAEAFPGSDKAKTVLLDKKLENTYDDDIYLGVGADIDRPKGVVFDEHLPDGRLENCCCSTLVAQRLRVLGKLQGLLDDVLACDKDRGVEAFQLASIVKAMHRVKKGQEQLKTIFWADDGLDAIAFRERDERFNLKSWWYDYVAEFQLDKQEDAVRHVCQVIAKASNPQGREIVTGLWNIGSRLAPDLRVKWLGKAFEILVADARLYQETLNSRFDVADIDTTTGMQSVTYMESESEHAIRAGKSEYFGKTALLIVRNSLTGHHFIGRDKKLSEGLVEEFKDFAAMVRMAEYFKRTKKRLSFEAARSMGAIPECLEWFLAFDNALMNGSLSHSYVPASALSLKELVDIAKCAFKASLRDEWLAAYQGQKLVKSTPVQAHGRRTKERYRRAHADVKRGASLVLDELNLGEIMDGKPSGTATVVVSTAPAPSPEVGQTETKS
jgi:hypothetical protein